MDLDGLDSVVAKTRSAELTYSDGIVSVLVTLDSDLDLEAMKEIVAARMELVDWQPHTVLIEAESNHHSEKEAREYLANYEKDPALAMAVVSNNLAVRLLANFYVKFDKPRIPTKLFKSREDALAWLKTFH